MFHFYRAFPSYEGGWHIVWGLEQCVINYLKTPPTKDCIFILDLSTEICSYDEQHFNIIRQEKNCDTQKNIYTGTKLYQFTVFIDNLI